jgi:MFS family permease
MSDRQRQGWLVITAFVVSEITVYGTSMGTTGVFITPLIRYFHWNHEQVSRIASAWALLYGLGCPVAGWLVDRINARWIVASGCALAGLGYLMASQIGTLEGLVACYALVGFGTALSADTVLMAVAVSWFGERSALAIGIGAAGRSIGLATGPSWVTWVVMHYGWRVGMAAIALPMLGLGLPVSLLLIRKSASQGYAAEPQAQAAPAQLPGLEVLPALGTIAFWLIVSSNLIYSSGTTGTVLHLIPYLISIAFTPAAAAAIFGVQATFAGIGHLVLGWLADRYGAKPTAVAAFAMAAVATMLLLGVANPRMGAFALVLFIPLWGFSFGGDTLMSVVLVQSLGRRRYGTLAGILNAFNSIGHMGGPLLIGMMYDLSGNYRSAFLTGAGLASVAAIAGSLVFPVKGHDQVQVEASALAV